MDQQDKRDIVEVIGEVLDSPMIPMGSPDRPYYHVLCPFHEDRTPSFYVYSASQRCGCYVCWDRPKGYDVIDFYMKMYGVSFEDAKRAVTEAVPPHIKARRRINKVTIPPDKIDAYALEMANYVRKQGKKNLHEIARTVTQIQSRLRAGEPFRRILKSL